MPYLTRKTISVIAMLVAPSASWAFDDAQFCREMQRFVERANQDRGVMLDQFTRNDGVVALCGTRVVDYKKFILAPTTALRGGWKERKRTQWNEIYCANPFYAPAIKAGWIISTTTTFVDGTRFVLTAECEG